MNNWETRKTKMLPYQAVAMDYAVTSGFQRHPTAHHQSPIGLGVNINPAFTHSWFVPADLCVPYKQTPLLEPGHVELYYMFSFSISLSPFYLLIHNISSSKIFHLVGVIIVVSTENNRNYMVGV